MVAAAASAGGADSDVVVGNGGVSSGVGHVDGDAFTQSADCDGAFAGWVYDIGVAVVAVVAAARATLVNGVSQYYGSTLVGVGGIVVAGVANHVGWLDEYPLCSRLLAGWIFRYVRGNGGLRAISAAAFSFDWQAGTNYEYGILENPARTAIHLMHRLGALVVFVSLVGLAVWMIWRRPVACGILPYVLLALLLGQVSLGISNVVFALPLVVATLHTLGAALLLLVVLALNYRLGHF